MTLIRLLHDTQSGQRSMTSSRLWALLTTPSRSLSLPLSLSVSLSFSLFLSLYSQADSCGADSQRRRKQPGPSSPPRCLSNAGNSQVQSVGKQSISESVCLCLSLSASVYLCLSLSLSVFFCQSLAPSDSVSASATTKSVERFFLSSILHRGIFLTNFWKIQILQIFEQWKIYYKKLICSMTLGVQRGTIRNINFCTSTYKINKKKIIIYNYITHKSINILWLIITTHKSIKRTQGFRAPRPNPQFNEDKSKPKGSDWE